MPGAEKHIKVLTNVWAHQVFKCLAYVDTIRVIHKDANRHAAKVFKSKIVHQ